MPLRQIVLVLLVPSARMTSLAGARERVALGGIVHLGSWTRSALTFELAGVSDEADESERADPGDCGEDPGQSQ